MQKPHRIGCCDALTITAGALPGQLDSEASATANARADRAPLQPTLDPPSELDDGDAGCGGYKRSQGVAGVAWIKFEDLLC